MNALPGIHPPTAIASLIRKLELNLVGRSLLVDRLAIALIAGGHVLVEGAPGLAKTRAVKLFAAGLDTQFARIQCTPDLLPSDITGSMIFQQNGPGGSGAFEFAPGPLFHNIILVDEINRAPPKVQSALLEAMGEAQVTVGGTTHPLPDPFMVVATQNPIEHEGTYPLPEAQLDRFLMHVQVDYPDYAGERAILELVRGEALVARQPDTGLPISRADTISCADIADARSAAGRVYISPAVADYIVRLVMATRGQGAAAPFAADIAHPASPRATLALASCAAAKAMIAGRDYVTPLDVRALAPDILAHRLILTGRAMARGQTTRRLIEDLVRSVAIV